MHAEGIGWPPKKADKTLNAKTTASNERAEKIAFPTALVRAQVSGNASAYCAAAAA